MNKNQKGFALVESLLIILILAVVGFGGYYVWHSQQKSKSSLVAAPNGSDQSRSASPTTSPQKNGPKYLNITQWGVRIPYIGSDTYSYTYTSDNPNSVEVVSANLAAKYGCNDFGGGMIVRLLPTDGSSPSGGDPSVKDYEAQHPGTYKYLNGYYFLITHDQASCSDSVTADAQNQVNQAVIALQSKIEVIPQ